MKQATLEPDDSDVNPADLTRKRSRRKANQMLAQKVADLPMRELNEWCDEVCELDPDAAAHIAARIDANPLVLTKPHADQP